MNNRKVLKSIKPQLKWYDYQYGFNISYLKCYSTLLNSVK